MSNSNAWRGHSGKKVGVLARGESGVGVLMLNGTALRRKTRETDIKVNLTPYGSGKYAIKTGISFLDHMLSLFAKHGLFNLKIDAKGDLDVDIHHTNEDIALILGEVFSCALKNKAGIKRFGEATLPMDEVLVRAVVDISGRPLLKFDTSTLVIKEDAAGYHLGDAEHFLRAFSAKLGATIHIDMLKSGDAHHVLEAIFKALALALRRAIEKEPRSKAPASTKGCI